MVEPKTLVEMWEDNLMQCPGLLNQYETELTKASFFAGVAAMAESLSQLSGADSEARQAGVDRIMTELREVSREMAKKNIERIAEYITRATR